MLRRSQGPPTHDLDLDIDRTLRRVRRLFVEQTGEEEEFFDSSSDISSDMGDANGALFGDFGNPGSHELQCGILLPTTETNFTIHPHYTQMVRGDQFSGAAHEDPIEHLDKFLETCALIQTNQVTQEYIRMHLFRYSLTGKAYRWLKNLKPSSLATWRDTAKDFLNKFIPEDKSTELRQKISSFRQERYESLGEAWDRFKEYVRACPHHEFDKQLLIKFFYDGLDDIPKQNLNSGCGGHISKVPQAQLEDTIEEVVRYYSTSGGRRRGEERASGKFELDQGSLKALMEQVIDKKLGNSQGSSSSSTNQVHSFSCENCGGTNHDISYCGGRDPEHVAAMGYMNNQRDNWRAPNANYGNRFQDASGPSHNTGQMAPFPNPNASNHPRAPFKQGPPNQFQNFQPNPSMQNDPNQQMIMETLNRIQSSLSAMDQRITNSERKADQRHQEVTAHQKMMDNQVAQLAERVTNLANEKLPGQPTTNPATTHHIKAISLRSGKSYEGPRSDQSEHNKEGEEQEVEEVHGDNQGQRIENSVEGGIEKKKGEGSEKSKEVGKDKQPSTSYQPSRFEPPPPYPERIVERRLNDKYNKFMAMLKSLHINIPFLEAMTQMPPYAKFLKELLSNKKKLSDECITLPHQVSALVQRTLPTKQCDPGSFTLPVKIGDMETTGALADLGASVSLMPLSIAKKLKFEMIPSRKVIQLADRSTKFPCGELEDVPIKIGNLFVPCDFVVMDMEEDPHTPLILGREALKTMGAVVNCKDNTITCEVANEKYKFEFSKTLKQPMVEKIWRVDLVDSELDELVKSHEVKLIPRLKEPWMSSHRSKVSLRRRVPRLLPR
ncbi:uncharacterized protein LOC110711466 [Chenopodium quinoa]|uniref:uncharacterized protein LOC110711466 n=1 Tax=Chenopodium quinoa TaxID=63459 RepID=UPI000B770B84|nr:uncharacterized protein LOC110711466 [Chenopodium quinoa]